MKLRHQTTIFESSRDKPNGADAFLCTLDHSTFVGSSLTSICHFYGRDVNRSMTIARVALLILMLSNLRVRGMERS